MIQINLQSTKKAFTTIELLVVVAIIGILAVGVSQIDFNGMNARQKRDRIASGVVTMIRNELTKNSTGKAIREIGGSYIYPTKTLVVVSADVVQAQYYSWSTTLSSYTLLSKPYFGEDKYKIISGTGTTASGGTVSLSFSGSEALVLELLNGKNPVLYYSGATNDYYTSAKIRLGFEPEYMNIDIDTRNNLIQIEK